MRKLLNLLTIGLFLTAGGLAYAYVYDIDTVSPAEVYLLERTAFLHRSGCSLDEFPDFQTWMIARCQFDNQARIWISDWLTHVGYEFAQIFDPSIQIAPIEYYHLQMPQVNE